MGSDQRDGGERIAISAHARECVSAAWQMAPLTPDCQLLALLQVLNLPVVRQFLFQPGDLPPPLADRGSGIAALPEGTPPTQGRTSTAQGLSVDLGPHDD